MDSGGYVGLPETLEQYVLMADRLEEMIDELVPDTKSRLIGHLLQLRLLAPRVAFGNYLPQDMTALQKSLDTILATVEVRRKELKNRSAGEELSEMWRDYRENGGVVLKPGMEP